MQSRPGKRPSSTSTATSPCIRFALVRCSLLSDFSDKLVSTASVKQPEVRVPLPFRLGLTSEFQVLTTGLFCNLSDIHDMLWTTSAQCCLLV